MARGLLPSPARAAPAAYLLAGLVGLVLAPALPEPLLLRAPVRIAVDVLVAVGLYGVLRGVLAGVGRTEADLAVPALAPALVTPVVVRVIARAGGTRLAAPLAVTLWFEATALAAAALSWWGLRRRAGAFEGQGRALAVGAVGLMAPGVLVGTRFLLWGPPPENAVVVMGSVALAGAAMLLQRRFAGGLPGALSMLGRWSPATVAGAQLLDGVVTSLAVETPFGLLPDGYVESNPISQAVLESIGPGFLLLKWGVGLVTGLVLEASFEDGDGPTAARKVGVYLLVLRFSLGPGAFSAFQLLR